MEWVIVAGLVWLVLFAWFLRECRRAPLGFQDENGFHEVEASGLEADLRRSREQWDAEKRERRTKRRGARA